MEALKLKAAVRQKTGKQVKYIRQNGLVPAVVYGRDVDSMPIQIEAKALTRVLTVAGTHQLISLELDGKKPQMTLARHIQRDILRRNYTHVDFYVVKMDEKVTAQVPLVIIGESPAVKDEGGVLTQGLDQLEVECLPADLISSIEVDIDGLESLNDTIIVADLVVPDTITVLSEPESMVVKIEPPRKIADLDEEAEESEVVVEDAAGDVEVVGETEE